MPHFLSPRWLLSRRHFLRGAGTMVALPLLNAMTPLRAADVTAAAKPRRSVFVYIPNGANGMTWQVAKPGRDYALSRALRPLERHRDDLTVFSGLHHPNGLGQAHVCADTWLTGARIDAQSARQYHNTVSVDQLMAEVTSPHTRFASLELSISSGTGQPNNTSTLAFSRDGVPLPAEDNPRVVFDRLFGAEPGGVDARRPGFGPPPERARRRAGRRQRPRRQARRGRPREARRVPPLGPRRRAPDGAAGRLARHAQARGRRRAVHSGTSRRSRAGDYYRTMFDLIALALRTDMPPASSRT